MVALPSGQIVSAAYVRATTDSYGNKNGVTLVDASTSPVCSSSTCAGQTLAPSAALGSDAAPPVTPLGPSMRSRRDSLRPACPTGPRSPPTPEVARAGAPGMTGSGGAPGTAGSPGAAGAAGSADAGATGGTPGGALLGNQYPDVPYFGPGPLSPSGIAIVPDGSQAYVSLANASFVISVGLTSSGLTLPGNGIYLHEGARGSSRIRLNVDPNRYRRSPAPPACSSARRPRRRSPGTTQIRRGEYLYAIARDGTLRVIQVANAGRRDRVRDQRRSAAPGARRLGRDARVSPSIRRTGGRSASAPAFISRRCRSTSPPPTSRTLPPTPHEQSVNGAYAWVITDSGIVYLVNLNPVLRNYSAVVPTTTAPPPPPMLPSYVLRTVTESKPFVNTLRDRNVISYSLTLDPSSGPPRVDVLPSVPATGPYIEPFWTQGSILNATALSTSYVQTVAFFPQAPNPPNFQDPIDRRAITPQTLDGRLGGRPVRRPQQRPSVGQ